MAPAFRTGSDVVSRRHQRQQQRRKHNLSSSGPVTTTTTTTSADTETISSTPAAAAIASIKAHRPVRRQITNAVSPSHRRSASSTSTTTYSTATSTFKKQHTNTQDNTQQQQQQQIRPKFLSKGTRRKSGVMLPSPRRRSLQRSNSLPLATIRTAVSPNNNNSNTAAYNSHTPNSASNTREGGGRGWIASPRAGDSDGLLLSVASASPTYANHQQHYMYDQLTPPGRHSKTQSNNSGLAFFDADDEVYLSDEKFVRSSIQMDDRGNVLDIYGFMVPTTEDTSGRDQRGNGSSMHRSHDSSSSSSSGLGRRAGRSSQSSVRGMAGMAAASTAVATAAAAAVAATTNSKANGSPDHAHFFASGEDTTGDFHTESYTNTTTGASLSPRTCSGGCSGYGGVCRCARYSDVSSDEEGNNNNYNTNNSNNNNNAVAAAAALVAASSAASEAARNEAVRRERSFRRRQLKTWANFRERAAGGCFANLPNEEAQRWRKHYEHEAEDNNNNSNADHQSNRTRRNNHSSSNVVPPVLSDDDMMVIGEPSTPRKRSSLKRPKKHGRAKSQPTSPSTPTTYTTSSPSPTSRRKSAADDDDDGGGDGAPMLRAQQSAPSVLTAVGKRNRRRRTVGSGNGGGDDESGASCRRTSRGSAAVAKLGKGITSNSKLVSFGSRVSRAVVGANLLMRRTASSHAPALSFPKRNNNNNSFNNGNVSMVSSNSGSNNSSNNNNNNNNNNTQTDYSINTIITNNFISNYNTNSNNYNNNNGEQLQHAQTVAAPNQNLTRRRLANMVRGLGIPPRFRAELWIKFTGAQEKSMSSTQTYAEMCESMQLTCDPETARVIERDLHRTFPTNYHFNDQSVIDSLRRVLLLYSVRNPSVGYCQSMNFLVAVLLLHMEEHQAFWVLCAMVEDLVPEYYTTRMTAMHIDQHVFADLVRRKLPKVHAHLTALSFPLSIITYQWFLCLFVNTLPLEATLRVWDCFLFEGFKALFRVGLAILRLLSRSILSSESFEEVHECLSTMPLHMDARRLLKMAYDPYFLGPFSASVISDLRLFYRPTVESDLQVFSDNDLSAAKSPPPPPTITETIVEVGEATAENRQDKVTRGMGSGEEEEQDSSSDQSTTEGDADAGISSKQLRVSFALNTTADTDTGVQSCSPKRQKGDSKTRSFSVHREQFLTEEPIDNNDDGGGATVATSTKSIAAPLAQRPRFTELAQNQSRATRVSASDGGVNGFIGSTDGTTGGRDMLSSPTTHNRSRRTSISTGFTYSFSERNIIDSRVLHHISNASLSRVRPRRASAGPQQQQRISECEWMSKDSTDEVGDIASDIGSDADGRSVSTSPADNASLSASAVVLAAVRQRKSRRHSLFTMRSGPNLGGDWQDDVHKAVANMQAQVKTANVATGNGSIEDNVNKQSPTAVQFSGKIEGLKGVRGRTAFSSTTKKHSSSNLADVKEGSSSDTASEPNGSDVDISPARKQSLDTSVPAINQILHPIKLSSRRSVTMPTRPTQVEESDDPVEHEEEEEEDALEEGLGLEGTSTEEGCSDDITESEDGGFCGEEGIQGRKSEAADADVDVDLGPDLPCEFSNRLQSLTFILSARQDHG